jgi:hypothetical protein
MNVNNMIDVIKEVIFNQEQVSGQPFTLQQKRELLVGAVNKWNSVEGNEFMIIPPVFLKEDS